MYTTDFFIFETLSPSEYFRQFIVTCKVGMFLCMLLGTTVIMVLV